VTTRSATFTVAFDPDRAERAYVGFGYRAHLCIGTSLARTELRAEPARLLASPTL
jgi:cytochrome P450